jgi:hypothetical protein
MAQSGKAWFGTKFAMLIVNPKEKVTLLHKKALHD